MATLGGARALGLEAITGSIEPGKRADLIVIRTDGPGWTPDPYPVSNIVYSTTGADVDTVMVDGDILMEGRQMTHLDEERILFEARSAAEALFERTGSHRGPLAGVLTCSRPSSKPPRCTGRSRRSATCRT